MKKVEIYTDGACSGNPGPGGWAAILKYNGHTKEISGYNGETTNNRMEMFAVIQGIRQLKERCEIRVYSDSAYLVDSFNKEWIQGWQSNNWRTAGNDAVKNIDLWKSLLMEIEGHCVEFIKVKGHSDNEYNNRCDEMARQEIKNCTV